MVNGVSMVYQWCIIGVSLVYHWCIIGLLLYRLVIDLPCVY